MIHVENVSLSYQGQSVFNDVSFSLQKGEKCGLVGRNGSGKTTLFRLLTKEEMPDRGLIAVAKHYRIGFLRQHIHFTQPTLLEEATLGLQESEREQLYRVEKMLFGLGFSKEDLLKAPSIFSGGYHLRLHLAKVLLSEPDCLLLDEPTNYLDIVSIRYLKRFLKQWKKEFILISHDRSFLDSVTTHQMCIHRQGVRKMEGNTALLFEQIALEEEMHEKERMKSEKQRDKLEAFVERFGAKATKASQAQARKKMIERLPSLDKLKELYNLKFRFTESPFFSEKMVEVEGVSFSYASRSIIQAVHLSIQKGERIAVIGKNGCGKSTFLRLLANELKPTFGKITCHAQVRIGYFGQTHIERLDHSKTVEEEIALSNPTLTYSEIKNRCGQMLFSGALSEKKISCLSGGERSRVLLGKILATPCSLLLLDEPTHHLDIESIDALVDAIEDFEGAVVLVSHSELMLQRLSCDTLLLFHEGGQTLFLGDYQSFVEKGGWQQFEKEPESDSLSSVASKNPRRERAERMAARSKLLRPIERDIEATETRLMTLEQEQYEAQQQLLLAIEQGRSQDIQAINKSMSSRIKTIESLYDQLEALLKKKEELT